MRSQNFTDDEAVDALKNAGGVVATAAKELGCTRQALNKRIRASELLKAARDEARAELLDVAESGLFKAVRAGRMWAIKFVLSRLGKDRGYGMNFQVDAQVNQAGRIVIVLPDDGRDEVAPTGEVLPDGRRVVAPVGTLPRE